MVPCDGDIVEGIEGVATDCDIGLVASSELLRVSRNRRQKYVQEKNISFCVSLGLAT